MELKIGNYYKPKHSTKVVVELIEIDEVKMGSVCQYRCKFDDQASKHGAYFWVKDTDTFLKDMLPATLEERQEYLNSFKKENSNKITKENVKKGQITLFDFMNLEELEQ